MGIKKVRKGFFIGFPSRVIAGYFPAIVANLQSLTFLAVQGGSFFPVREEMALLKEGAIPCGFRGETGKVVILLGFFAFL